MKLLVLTLLSLVFVLTGCKPDAAVKRGAVIDQPSHKATPQPDPASMPDQQPPQKKVQ